MNPYLISQTPLIIGIFSLLIFSAYWKNKQEQISLVIAALSLVASTVLLFGLKPGETYFGGSIEASQKNIVLAAVVLVLTLLALLATGTYLEKVHAGSADWRLMALLSAMGGVNLSLAGDIATLFVSFELLSIPAYAIAGFSRRDPRSNESGLKYLLLGATSSAFLLLGIVFLFGATGEIHLARIMEKLDFTSDSPDRTLAKIALALIISSLFFKAAVAPFHWWIMDVYHGASYAALSIIAIPVKIASFAFLERMLNGPFRSFATLWVPFVLIAALLSFAFGAMQGIRQTNIKRLLASSSVVNAGFIVLAVAFAGQQVFVLYLAVYGIMTFTAVVSFMAAGTKTQDVDIVEDLRGLGRTNPFTASVLTFSLFSLAGIPLTAGFMAKFGVLYEVFRRADMSGENSLFPLVSTHSLIASAMVGAIFGTVLSFYFYFRLIRETWFITALNSYIRERTWNLAIAAIIGCAAILILGVYPRLFLLFLGASE